MEENQLENQLDNQSILPVLIEDEMRTAYIDYSMSVIVSRALPDARDGLKPVHRRVLYSMDEQNFAYNRPHKKSARVVGDVISKYHPHGDKAIYDTLVRMAQDWSLRYPLVDGQGNFGSIDGDAPAAMRYTEVRMRRLTDELMADIKKETVDYQTNFDDSMEEPTVLPTKIPNLLLNGSTGIAVGMATNMAPHNLTEVCYAITAYIQNKDITIPEIQQYIKGPDFPTGGIIYGLSGIKNAFESGRGRIVIRSKASVEITKTGKNQIIVTEIPYMVSKADMIKTIADLVNDKKIEGISEIRDESDRDGLRIAFDLKREAVPNVVLNNLYKYSPLQSSFSVNNVALVKGRPMILNIKDLIRHFVEHRNEVIIRRTQYDLKEARKRAHILEGFMIALDHLDLVIRLIRGSKDPEEAKNGLMTHEQLLLSAIQAQAILELRLQRLTGMERQKIMDEYKQIQLLIENLESILASPQKQLDIIVQETNELREKFGDERRTDINSSDDEINIEDIIADEEMLITVSSQGYIKRTTLTEYKAQGRGGVGSKGVTTKEDDYTANMLVATMHNYLLFFTQKGRCYWLRVYSIPEGSKTSKGRPIQNMISIEPDDSIQTIINTKQLNNKDYVDNNYIVMCTENGTIKRMSLEDFSRPRTNGIIAITINEGDKLLDASLTNGSNEIILTTRTGRSCRFSEDAVRVTGRTAAGVRGIWLDENNPEDSCVGMVCITNPEQQQLMVISEKGFGKRSEVEEFRKTNRAGKGVRTLNITEKTGLVVGIKEVTDNDDLIIITKSGVLIRFEVNQLRVMGRNTQGVKLIRLRSEEDSIGSVTKIQRVEEVGEIIEEENVDVTE